MKGFRPYKGSARVDGIGEESATGCEGMMGWIAAGVCQVSVPGLEQGV